MKTNRFPLPLLIFPFLLGLGGNPAVATIRLPAIFGDHMVLQEEATLPVWGWAAPGEKITVTFGKDVATATADADGKWRASLTPLPNGTPPGTLIISGSNTITISDVLVGDVWLCSGQSNMELPTYKLQANPVAPSDATDNQIRLFHVPRKLGLVPLDDVTASWQVCSPDSVKDFSAVGFFFAKDLRMKIPHPIGMIESAWGATTAPAWTSLDALNANPVLAHYIDEHTKALPNYPGGEADFEAKVAAYNDAQKKWSDDLAANPDYQQQLKAYYKIRDAAMAGGQTIPPMPQPATPSPMFPPCGHHNAPAALFNAMINPIIPFALKGVLWYQGEDNSKTLDSAFNYRTMLPTLINDWRTRWQQGNFPFLFVQLAGFTAPPKTAGDTSLWALVRESQLRTLTAPKTGMAVAVDIGSVGNIHPPDKVDVALRLSLVARRIAYGEAVVYTGPIYDSFQAMGDSIHVSFTPDSIGSGLIIGAPPCIDPKAPSISTTELQGFAIAGEDKMWHWASAKIDGSTVVVSSPDVPKPIAVRYAWATHPTCNLYNKENLPASPFRTDDWEISAADAAKAAVLTR